MAIALLLVTCTLLAQWHEAAVVHVRCAAHGELMHVTTGDDPGVHSAALGERRLAPHSGDSGAEHDHCALCAVHGSISTPHCIGALTDHPAIALLSPPRPSELVARATFRLAPKTSPPG